MEMKISRLLSVMKGNKMEKVALLSEFIALELICVESFSALWIQHIHIHKHNGYNDINMNTHNMYKYKYLYMRKNKPRPTTI